MSKWHSHREPGWDRDLRDLPVKGAMLPAMIRATGGPRDESYPAGRWTGVARLGPLPLPVCAHGMV